MLTRPELGTLLHMWQTSQFDTHHVVGSYYIGESPYPDKDMVEECLASLSLDLDKYQKMSKGEKVSGMTAFGFSDDWRQFGNLTDENIKDTMEELMVMVSSLRGYILEDYPTLH